MKFHATGRKMIPAIKRAYLLIKAFSMNVVPWRRYCASQGINYVTVHSDRTSTLDPKWYSLTNTDFVTVRCIVFNLERLAMQRRFEKILSACHEDNRAVHCMYRITQCLGEITNAVLQHAQTTYGTAKAKLLPFLNLKPKRAWLASSSSLSTPGSPITKRAWLPSGCGLSTPGSPIDG